ncbi:MAG: hypothetical protein ACRBN8_30425 [Nannocystales bacterium]
MEFYDRFWRVCKFLQDSNALVARALNSIHGESGKYIIAKPRIGIWSKKQRHKHRRSSQRSGRAAFADRSTVPETAVLMLDRPRILPELSDEELRTKISEGRRGRKAKIRVERGGKPVLGMKVARSIPRSTVPVKGEKLFGRQPTSSTQTREQRSRMRRLRRRFLQDYRLALARWNAGLRDVVFPAARLGCGGATR